MKNNVKRTLKLQDIRYAIIDDNIWWRDIEGILLKCVNHEELVKILTKMHSGVCGGHYMSKKTTHKVLRFSFWWPTLFKDAHEMVRKCDAC